MMPLSLFTPQQGTAARKFDIFSPSQYYRDWKFKFSEEEEFGKVLNERRAHRIFVSLLTCHFASKVLVKYTTVQMKRYLVTMKTWKVENMACWIPQVEVDFEWLTLQHILKTLQLVGASNLLCAWSSSISHVSDRCATKVYFKLSIPLLSLFFSFSFSCAEDPKNACNVGDVAWFIQSG